MKHTVRVVAVMLTVVVVHAWSRAEGSPPDELQRKSFLGTLLGPLDDEVREAQKLGADDGGAVVLDVVAGSSARAAGLQAGDVVRRAGEAVINGPQDLVRAMTGVPIGAKVALAVVREGKPITIDVTLQERPRETSDDYAVVYGSVESRGHRLRTILTRPRGDGPFPAFFLIQGITTSTVDHSIGALSTYRTICDAMTREGFVTLRVDKPGAGDSEGGPARDVDFEAELDGYRQALSMLAGTPGVDPKRIVIFGHSMGGVMAPLLGPDTPVRGIAVYGTIAKTWPEYMLANVRRQLELSGEDAGVVDDAMHVEAAVIHYLFAEKLAPSIIAAKHPELASRLEDITSEDRYYVDRSIEFFRQLSSKSLGDAWQRFGGKVLAIWGEADFVSAEDDHILIARILNKERPGAAAYRLLDDTDHGFSRASDAQEAMRRTGPGEFNPAVVETLRDWAKATVEAS
jgi:dienelactone hydrolase